MGCKNLHLAYRAKNDEFYTSYNDVARELSRWRFNGAKIYCPCDGPDSNFVKYILDYWDRLGVSELTHTWLGSEYGWRYTSPSERKAVEAGDGDALNDACSALLDRADFVITNPPFSVRALQEKIILSGKHYILLLPIIRTSVKTFYEFMRRGIFNAAHTNIGSATFATPDGGVKNAPCGYYTDLHIERPFYYSGRTLAGQSKYLDWCQEKYCGDPILDVKNYSYLPDDYNGPFRVSTNFLWTWNKNQFELIGDWELTKGLHDSNGGSKFPGLILKRRVL